MRCRCYVRIIAGLDSATGLLFLHDCLYTLIRVYEAAVGALETEQWPMGCTASLIIIQDRHLSYIQPHISLTYRLCF